MESGVGWEDTKEGLAGHERQGVRQGNRKTEFVSGILIEYLLSKE